MPRSRLKNTLVTLLKVGLAATLLAYLYYKARQEDAFTELVEKPKDWPLLALAAGCCLASILATFVRWMLLVRALGLRFSFGDALRLGFQGFALNFVSLGSVGGDLFKAVFIAREQHGHKTEAIATVVVDRLIGLYALFLVATVAIFLGDYAALAEVSEVQWLRRATLLCTAIGALSLVALLLPGPRGRRIGRALAELPLAGPVLGKLIGALRMYRQRYPVVALTLLLSVLVHTMLALTLWLIAAGLPGAAPSLAEHFFITPLAALVGAIPLTPSGLGSFEWFLAFLYEKASASSEVARSQGFIVALCYRLITMLVALVGVYYLVRGRRKVAEAMHEAEQEDQPQEQAAGVR